MNIALLIIPIILIFGSQALVNSTYKKYRLYKVKNSITGSEVARKILDSNNLANIKVLKTSGELTDHFDPKNKTVNLSEYIYSENSVASVAVAAHECGHAIQHKENYLPIIIREKMVPIVNFASKFGYVILIVGLIAQIFNVALIGLIFMAVALIFQLVTLPVEFNASKRAKKILIDLDIVDRGDSEKVSHMLTVAAMTYLASFFATLLQMLRLLLIISGGKRRG